MDNRIEFIMDEYKRNDKSFQEKESALELMLQPFGKKFNKHEMRENWHRGIRHGIEIGFHKASLEGQRIELHNNTIKAEHKEFLEKFYKLAEDYGCAIQYHPLHGMVIGKTRTIQR